MSQENLEIVERAMHAFNWRDFDAYDELFTPDIEFASATVGAVEGGSYRGREGVERYAGEIDDIVESWVVVEDVRDLGEQVFLGIRVEARGRGGGVPVTAPQWVLIDFRDQRIARSRAFLDHDEALRAAGLAE